MDMKFENLASVINHMNVYVRRAIYDIVPIGWEIYERIIFDYELLYIAKGRCYIKLGENEYNAKAGDLFFIKPGIRHAIKSEGEERLHQPHIHFDLHYDSNSSKVYIPVAKDQDVYSDSYLLRPDVTTKNLLNIREYYRFQDESVVFNLIQSVIKLQNSVLTSAIIRKNAYLLELLSLLVSATEAGESKVLPPDYHQELFERTNNVIESNYNRPLSIAEIADQIGYSKNYFTHIYKENFGKTPKQYYEEIKLNKAESYLQNANISVTEISHTLGFDSIHEFSRFFKRKTGLSPSEWRKERN